jgi:hypothetical protein
MKRYPLYFLAAIITFFVGVFLSVFWLDAVCLMSIRTERSSNKNIESPILAFDCRDSVRGRGQRASVNGAIRGSCVGSDGSIVFDADYRTFTETEAKRTFESIIKASNVIDITPILDDSGNEIGKRALTRAEEGVKIIKIMKVDEKKFYTPYIVFEIEAHDLKHLLAFENQEPGLVQR